MERTKGHLELMQANNPNGRRSVKMVLHEIYPDATQWNSNGISYLEQYTRDNAESVKGMPLCAEFLDKDKDIPWGHGLTGNIENMPVFEDSVQVGSFEDWSIEDIEIDGKKHRCLCATGYINEGRYPKFVKWIEDQIADGMTVRGSVEFVGTKENDGDIIYDGGWKEEGRIPMVYDYSGYCILSVEPSDSAAILLELNQKLEKNEFDDICVYGNEVIGVYRNGSSEDFDCFEGDKSESKVPESNMFDDMMRVGTEIHVEKLETNNDNDFENIFE